MKTIKTILTVTLFSAFLFSCEAEQDFAEDNLEDVEVKAGELDFEDEYVR